MLKTVSRRTFLAGTASLGALGATGLAAPAIAQGALTQVKFTLPFVAQGATAFAFVARERGFFRARGLDVDIALGTGSPPAAQAIASGQFDIGLVSAAATIQQAARGLNLVAVGTMMYDATMAVAVPADSPIRTAKDLEGKRLGANPRGLDFAFWPAYARLAGINTAGITVQQLDPNVLERTLAQRQVDAVTCVAASSLPTFQSLNLPVRFLMWKDAGLNFYHNTVVTRPEVVAQRPQIVQGVVDALGDDGVLLMPAAPQAAFAHGTRAPVNQADFTGLANIAGLPAIALPSGWNDDGLPVSVQLVGPPGSERRLIFLARQVDGALNQYKPPRGE